MAAPAPVKPGEGELYALARIRRLIEETGPGGEIHLRTGRGDEALLPESLHAVLLQALPELEDGRAVAVTALDKRLTTQQAADLLNVSRPFLVRLLEDGHIPFEKVGTHRRVKLEDVLAFARRRSADRRAVFRELAQQAQTDGLV